MKYIALKELDRLLEEFEIFGEQIKCYRLSEFIEGTKDNGKHLWKEFDNEKTLEKAQVTDLLKQIGSQGECKGCGLPIWWIEHTNGKNVPYTNQGLNHFIDCPNANFFRKKQK